MHTPADQTANDRMIPRVRAGHVELAVIDRGAGPPLVLVHGFPLDHSMWQPQIDFFSTRRRVVAPDLRGFGASQIVSGTASMEAMADDLDVLLDALGITEPVVVCGLSMGGYVALQFWRKYARRLRALVLCDTRAVADTPEAARLRSQQVDLVLREGMAPLAEAMLPKLFAAATFASQPGVVAGQRSTILAARAEGVAAALLGMAARPDATDYLPRIALPTLVVVGQHDAISTVDEMRGMARAIPEAELVVIPDAGHMSPLENPAAFNAALEQFLARVERGAPLAD